MLQASSQRLHPEQADGSRAIQMGFTIVFTRIFRVLGEGGLFSIRNFRGYLAGIRTLSKYFMMNWVSTGCMVYNILASPLGMKSLIL